jgi:putative adhesin
MRTETFQTPNPVRLDIRLGAGEVRLEASQTSETTVRLEPLRDNDASVSAVEEARVEQRGDEILIDVRDRRRGFRGSDVLVEVRCPEGSSVRAKTGSADIEGHGRFGSADVETGSGDVQFGDLTDDAKVNAASGDVQIAQVGGEARINTASGDIQVASIGRESKLNSASGDVMVNKAGGPIEVNSASGDVMVREASSSVGVNTASGDQLLGSVVEGKVDLKSASGDLKIGIREGSTLWVDARSRSGEVVSELPVSDLPPEGDAPHVELRANSMSGDITVVRA